MLLVMLAGCFALPGVQRDYRCGAPDLVLDIETQRSSVWRFNRGLGCRVRTDVNAVPLAQRSSIRQESRNTLRFASVGDGEATVSGTGGLRLDWSNGLQGGLPASLVLENREFEEWRVTSNGDGFLIDLPDVLEIDCEDCTLDLRGRSRTLELNLDRARVKVCLDPDNNSSFDLTDSIFEFTPSDEDDWTPLAFAPGGTGLIRVGTSWTTAQLQGVFRSAGLPGYTVVRMDPDPRCAEDDDFDSGFDSGDFFD